MYFDPLPETLVTFNVKGFRVYEVYDLKSAPVRVYSYTSSGEKLFKQMFTIEIYLELSQYLFRNTLCIQLLQSNLVT